MGIPTPCPQKRNRNVHVKHSNTHDRESWPSQLAEQLADFITSETKAFSFFRILRDQRNLSLLSVFWP